MKRIPFVAIGTGRCGTVSLSRIVGACRRVVCTHEAYVTNWYTPKESRLRKLISFLSQDDGNLHGEVQPHLLPHLSFVREQLPALKVVCLHRPCAEVVASFLRRGIDKLRPSARPRQKNTKWVERLPDIEAYSYADAVRYYWEMYEKYMAEMKDAFHLEMRELNDDAVVTRLFDFLEIPEEDRIYIDNRVFNQGSVQVEKDQHEEDGEKGGAADGEIGKSEFS